MKKQMNVRVLTTAGMLVAVAVVFGFFKIPITQIIEIRFQFLPIACGAMLFGPVVGGIIGALADILGYLVKPTGPFFPGFTLSAVIQGILYGLFLYHREITAKRVIPAQAANTLTIDFLLNPLWLSILYGRGFIVIFTERIAKNLIMFPINVVLLLVVLRPVYKHGKNLLYGTGGGL